MSRAGRFDESPLVVWRTLVDLRPVTLEGRRVRLAPLSMDHLDELCRIGLNESLWQYSPTLVQTNEDMRRYIQTSLKLQDEGTVLPFVTIEKSVNRIVGSTRYLNIDAANKRCEIGATWVVPDWQRTYVNTESKYLLLNYAFDRLGCVRVEFKTDSLNTPSRNALVRIGATEEGILRNHMIMPDGRLRHSVYYSITDDEWRDVKKNLEEKLRQG